MPASASVLPRSSAHNVGEMIRRQGENDRPVLLATLQMSGERLGHHRWPVDFEPSHPKMGVLVKETSERASSILDRKR
jgi:hypothetical protein